jgi:hypothetical protein
MFKNHPDFKNIKFVLAPNAREEILGIADIPLPIGEVLKQMGNLFPNLDTSALKVFKDQN